MRLELRKIQVIDAQWSEATRAEKGVLYINRAEAAASVRDDAVFTENESLGLPGFVLHQPVSLFLKTFLHKVAIDVFGRKPGHFFDQLT